MAESQPDIAAVQGVEDFADLSVAAAPVHDGADRWRASARFAGQLATFALQISGLWALNFAGVRAVKLTALPIPGNPVGMVALYALLAPGVVKASWFDAAGSFLVRHLAFFFVPITVGLMDSGTLLATHGIGIMLVLATSAAISILLAGSVSQILLRKPWRQGGRS